MLNFLFWLGGIYLLICVTMYFFQEKLMFFPVSLHDDFVFNFHNEYEEVFLKNGDARLHALHFRHSSPKGVVLYFHGNAGSVREWGEVANDFLSRGYEVLMTDYRTYGKSNGSLSQKAILEDAMLFFAHVEESFSRDQIIVYGRSMGTGPAAYVASQQQPARLILETPYFSLKKAASGKFPWLPVPFLLRYPMPLYQYLEKVSCPIQLIHGTKDKVIPVHHSKELKALFPDHTLEYLQIEGGTHNDLGSFPSYHQLLDSLLK